MNKGLNLGTAPGRVAWLVGLVLLLVQPGWAQTGFEAEGFQVADHFDPPNETVMKSLLKGARARPLSNDLTLLIQAELEMFQTNGQRQLLVRAPQCFYDRARASANSAGPMSAETADGKFTIEGQGFLWRETNASLFISNHVHSLVHPELLDRSATNAPPKTASPASGLNIYSDTFQYSSTSGVAIYAGHGRVIGTNLYLVGQRLVLNLPEKEAQKPASLKSILVQTNVLLNYTNYTGTNATFLQATGQRGYYDAATGLVRVTGEPAWRAEQREGTGDELVIDRTNKIFQANGHAWLKLPGQTLGGLLMVSNTTRATAVPAANRLVEIWSDSYEFRTNWGIFRNTVRVRESEGGRPHGTMTCGLMTVSFGPSNTLDRLVAFTNVVIQKETNRFTGGKAVYTGTNGVLDLTIKPTWRSGVREGKGGLVRVNTQRDELAVWTNAWLRMPAKELGQSTATVGASSQKRAFSGPNQFADIYCEYYILSRDASRFRGGVYASHTNMNWACESLLVQAIPGGHVLTAEQGVVFDLVDERGQKTHGMGDKAVYTNSIVAGRTNDLLTLTGRPAVLSTTNGTWDNPVILLDRANGTLTTPGPAYHIRGTAKALDITNMSLLPQTKHKK